MKLFFIKKKKKHPERSNTPISHFLLVAIVCRVAIPHHNQEVGINRNLIDASFANSVLPRFRRKDICSLGGIKGISFSFWIALINISCRRGQEQKSPYLKDLSMFTPPSFRFVFLPRFHLLLCHLTERFGT